MPLGHCTPAVALGEHYQARLEQQGLTFEVLDTSVVGPATSLTWVRHRPRRAPTRAGWPVRPGGASAAAHARHLRAPVAGAVHRGRGRLATVWTLVGLFTVADAPPAVDRAAHDLALQLQSPTVVRVARFTSWVGDLPIVSAIALVVVAIAYRRAGRWDLGWLTLATIGGALAVTATVKGLTDRARPDGGLTDTFSSAFPSGHAVRAAAVYSLVAWLVLRWTSRSGGSSGWSWSSPRWA
jgi:membrane-associated phospholipid phosphatase